jgi:hypothetical protein
MTSETIIAFSATVEPWLLALVAAAVVVLLVDVLAHERSERRAPGLDAPIAPRTERALLAVLLVAAALVRVVGWDRALTPVFWFSEVPTLVVQRIIDAHAAWRTWIASFRATQVGWSHESVFGLPIQLGLQWALGARFGLPVLGGALYGVLSVLLAWALGRRVRSQAFGLVFAAFVAFSPLQLTWSRLGTYYIGAVPHVLLALLVGWSAGRRGSLVLALLTGLVAWTSLYHYYAARVAIPLAVVAIVAGSQRGWQPARGVVLALVAAAAFGGLAWWLHGHALRQALWPSYGGYAGNRGERTLTEFVMRNFESFRDQLWLAFDAYFHRRRTGWSSDVWKPGMAEGGLVLLPLAILGVLGLAVVCVRWRRQWIWLVVAAAGVTLPTLSIMTARRALVFDVAWCAFAAHGLLALVDGALARFGRLARARVAIGATAGIALASVATVFTLSAALPPGGSQHIPFGESGFGDGLACKRCLAAAKQWSDDIAGGAYVVLFDNDVQLENRTSPGGLATYGKIATLVARKPDRFVEAYALMGDWDLEPPSQGSIFDKARTSFDRYLIESIERAAPARVVWHFEQPSLWERWLADRLTRAGGAMERFDTPLTKRTQGIRVVTPWERRAEAFAVLREVGAGLAPGADSRCVNLTLKSSPAGALGPTFLLATPDAGVDAPPDWLMSSWRENHYQAYRLTSPLSTPVGVHFLSGPAGVSSIELIGQYGERTTFALPSLKSELVGSTIPLTLGLNCAAWLDGFWWTLDPTTGKVTSGHRAAASVPSGAWIGLATAPAGELVLAGADQTIVVFDPTQAREVRRFPARVSPSVRDTSDECSPIATGFGWIATVNLRTGVLSLYDDAGRDAGTRRLDEAMQVGWTLTTIGGAGYYLGGAAGAVVRTFQVGIDHACVAGEAAQ